MRKACYYPRMTTTQKKFAVRLYLVSTTVATFLLGGIVVAEAYIRWSLNQNFTLLGNSGLVGVCCLVLGLMLGVVYLVSHEK